MIKLKNIEIGYASMLFSIENIDLEKGKVYALIGANGAGKTTFLQTLIGLKSTIKGVVEINNRSVETYHRIEKAKLIAYVASKLDAIDYLKVKDYIGLGRLPYTNALGRLSPLDHEIVERVIDLLKIDFLSQKYITELSDGERQLTAIARALVQETDLIILDEPTAFLDYSNRKKVIDLVKDIAIEFKKCIIVSSHDLELCLESEIELLVINKLENRLDLFQSNSIAKDRLISIGF